MGAILYRPLILTHCGLVPPHNDIELSNIGLGNGLLRDGAKPFAA